MTEFNIANHHNVRYNFTEDQQKAIDGIIDFIAKPFNNNNYIIGLTGAGGTGKTFITRYIITHCLYSPSLISCTSSTHKACRVFSQAIGGMEVNTIQSTLGLRLDMNLEDFDPEHPQFNPKGKHKLDNIKLLFIDEASMIPAKLVTYICNVCKAKQIKIVFIGDASQLSPVNELCSIAFKRCSKVYNLTQIVRQKEDNPVSMLLEMLRDDINDKHKRYRFINYINTHIEEGKFNSNNEGFCVVEPNTFRQYIDKAFSNVEYTKNVDMHRIIGYTNICVSGWNNYVRNRIIRDADKHIITRNDLIMSYVTIVDDFLRQVMTNSDEYIIKDIVNFVDGKYKFKGFLVKFQKVHGGNITSPVFIIDHRDPYTVMYYNKILLSLLDDARNASSSRRSSKWKAYFDFKRKYLLAANIVNYKNEIIFSRDIDYGFAITSHRSQGSTYDDVYVDLNDMLFDQNGFPYTNQDDVLRRLYVACSRARRKLIICYGTNRSKTY